MREDALPYRRRFTGPPSWIGVIIIGGSIPLALISPTLAVLTWLLMFVAGRWVRDRASGLSAPG